MISRQGAKAQRTTGRFEKAWRENTNVMTPFPSPPGLVLNGHPDRNGIMVWNQEHIGPFAALTYLVGVNP